MTESKTVLEQILDERKTQDEKWGGKTHDDTHSAWDWIAYITKHAGKAVTDQSGQLLDLTVIPEPLMFRYQMIRVAALAIAAIEWIDRKHT